jgi:cell division initiation protein
MDTTEFLTPLDVQEKRFQVRWRGYAVKEVEAFLERVSETLHALRAEKASLQSELERREKELEEFRKREQLLKDTLINAQKVIEMMKANAQKEAENIIHEAEVKAEKILQETFQRQARIKSDIAELQRLKGELSEQLRSVLDRHVRLLEEKGRSEPAA